MYKNYAKESVNTDLSAQMKEAFSTKLEISVFGFNDDVMDIFVSNLMF